MLEKFFYYATTFAEAGLAVFGINGVFEQPRYTVRQDLGARLEIRDYGPALAAEATVTAPTRDQASETAFRLLFGYITGGNIAMTAPVQQQPALIEMTAPVRVETSSEGGQARGGQVRVTMRFFLPAKHTAQPPRPEDPRVRLTRVPATTVAALRFSGNPSTEARAANERQLTARLAATQWAAKGMPYLLGYDPPFTIPFLKRNEVAVEVAPR